MICYIDHGGTKSTYPKCASCGLPGHSADNCFLLINFCIAQALAAQHPEVVRKIKAAYKQFRLNARSITPCKATIKQIIAFLDLPTTDDMHILIELKAPDVSDFIAFSTAKWVRLSSSTDTKLGTLPLHNHLCIR
jgi:hypothetical protein